MLLFCAECQVKTPHHQHTKLRQDGDHKWRVEMKCRLCGKVKDCDFCQEDFDGTDEEVITMQA